MNLTRRPRRLRRTAQIRNLVHEVDVRCDDLIYPVFVTEGENVQSPIESMPGIYHYSLDRLAIHLKEVWEKGVRAVIFSGCRIIRMPAEAVLTTRMGLYREP